MRRSLLTRIFLPGLGSVVLAMALGELSVPAASWGASAPACVTSRLVTWVDGGQGTAGSSYYRLNFTNFSGHACVLHGYPGVSAVDILGGRLGDPAGRLSGGGHEVTVRNHQTVTATLRVIDVGAYSNARCHRTQAAGLRVYPPNLRVSERVPFPFRACGRSGPAYLYVGPVH